MRPVSIALTVSLGLGQWLPVLLGYPAVPRLTRSPLGPARATKHLRVSIFSRILPAVVALTVCAALPALAYASPPDPVWIQGIYDDADYDDVVGLITTASGDAASMVPADLSSPLPLIGNLQQSDEEVTLARTTAIVQSRAPPAR